MYKINLKLTQNGKTADYSIITDKKGVAKFNTKDLKIGITAGASTNKAELEELKQLIKKDLEEI